MTLDTSTINDLAAKLYQAERDRKPIGALTDAHPDMGIPDAYGVQLEGIRLRRATGSNIMGWKVGLTSKAMQKMLGVDQPDFGHLLDHTRIESGGTLDTSEFIWPRVEPEVGFELKADLRGPGVTVAQVMDATSYLVPALEVIDSRIAEWKIKLCDTISDNASCGRFVFSQQRTRPDGIDLSLIGMNFYLNDELLGTATSAAVVGNPAEAVAWLANTLAPYGHYLAAGQMIMPGSLVAAADAKPGGKFRADFDHIGSVELLIK
jgi:2-keto-4-pentenoate hydratase